MARSVVLLSGGLDSTVNLYEAKKQSDVLLALTFDYGQRAAPSEVKNAQATCERLGVPHKVVGLPWFHDFVKTALVNRDAEVPTDMALDDLKVGQQTAKAVWVPNRNGILLNIGAGFAEAVGADWLVPGFNIEEGATFPDNTQEYLDSLTHSFRYSTATGVKAICFTTQMNKTQIYKRGLELGVEFGFVWPCYFDGPQLCGHCESCRRYLRAKGELT